MSNSIFSKENQDRIGNMKNIGGVKMKLAKSPPPSVHHPTKVQN
jgi:hypothetical protein